MKLPILIFSLGALFFLGCVGYLVFSGGEKEVEAPVLEADSVATTTAPEPSAIAFSEEGRSPSAPANAAAVAPECDRGVADPGADEERMRMGMLSAFTKESVVQAILRRNALFSSASANCIRTYLRIGMAVDGGDWSELETMSDERIVAMARFMAVISREDRETDSEFRARMLGNEAQWMYEGPEMKVGFEEEMENGSVTTYQTATLVNGFWY